MEFWSKDKKDKKDLLSQEIGHLEDNLEHKIDHLENHLDKKVDVIEDKVDKSTKAIKDIDHELWEIQKSTRTLFHAFEKLHNDLRAKYNWYYNWHLKPYANTTHWLTLSIYIVLIILLILYGLGFLGGVKTASYAAAGIPKMVNYQGKLTNASNIPVADGSYNFIIRIYDSEADGSCLWAWKGTCGSPTAVAVTTANGIFSVMLGDTGYASTNALTLDFNTDSYWMQVEVGGETLTPRKRLGAVGYAYNSDTVDGRHESEFALLAGRSGGQTLIGGSAVTDDLILRTTSGAGESGADMIFQTGNNGGTEAMRILFSGNIGIGAVSPAARLEVEISSTAAVTGLLVDQDDLDQIGVQVTNAVNATATMLDFATNSISGNLINLDWDGATQATGNVVGEYLDFTNLTPVNNAANYAYGLHINDPAAANSATSYGLYLQGTNWDYAMYVEDKVFIGETLTVKAASGQDILVIKDGSDNTTATVNNTGELSFSNAGRHARRIQLNAEYPGAVLSTFYGSGTDASITGTMTSDTDTAGNLLRNYYEWTSSEASLNYYTVPVRITLPQDFSAWATSDAIVISFATESTDAANNLLSVYVYNSDDTPGTVITSSTSNKSSVAGTWATVTIDDSALAPGSNPEWTTAGHTGMIYLRMGSKSDNYTHVGDIKLNYLSKW